MKIKFERNMREDGTSQFRSGVTLMHYPYQEKVKKISKEKKMVKDEESGLMVEKEVEVETEVIEDRTNTYMLKPQDIGKVFEVSEEECEYMLKKYPHYLHKV